MHLLSHSLAVGAASDKGIRPGDRLLEVNGESVRGLTHREAGQLIADCPDSVTLLLHTRKPVPVPKGGRVRLLCDSPHYSYSPLPGNVVHSGWLSKKGGSGFTPRNWRRRWFVVRDDCIAYYYNGPEVQPFAYSSLHLFLLASPSIPCSPLTLTGARGSGGHRAQKLHCVEGNTRCKEELCLQANEGRVPFLLPGC